MFDTDMALILRCDGCGFRASVRTDPDDVGFVFEVDRCGRCGSGLVLGDDGGAATGPQVGAPIERRRPWVSVGISRRTWYRRKARGEV